jgi:SAM-dependent methyltransferase
LAGLGAKVTGIDFSESAIELAQELTKRTKLEANFICSYVYDLPRILNKKYDIVFTGIGALCWLHNIKEWGSIVANYLDENGVFLLVESHPIMWIFDDKSSELRVKYSYWHSGEPSVWDEDGTYADESAKIHNRTSYDWQHIISDILNSLISAELTIEQVNEYPHLQWKYVQNAEKNSESSWSIPGDPIPQMWSVKATRGSVKKGPR